jgi:hypothetical protein
MIFMSIGQLIGHLSNQHPYLDPGNSSILIQLLLAGLLGAGILLRASWSRIRKFFSRNKADQTDDDDDGDDE